MRLPFAFEMKGKEVLVVGGGCVGLRKTKELIRSEASVSVVSDAFVSGFYKLEGYIRIEALYEFSHIEDKMLVIAATDDRSVNERIARDCEALGKWCLRADDMAASDVSSMVVHRVGALTVAVSTEGKSPGYSKAIMTRLRKAIPEDAGDKLQQLGILREKIKASAMTHEKKKRLMAEAIGMDINDMKSMIEQMSSEREEYGDSESDF